MREIDIEDYLVKQVEKAGGKAYKLVCIGRRGFPDRTIVFKHPFRVYFVELKTRRGTISPPQRGFHAELRRMGGEPVVLRSTDEIDAWLLEKTLLYSESAPMPSLFRGRSGRADRNQRGQHHGKA